MEKIITKENFESEVLNSEIPVVLDFWATWCGPCRMVAPELSKVAEEYEGKITVGKINVDEQATLAEQYGIEVIPTLVLIKEGKESKRISGYFDKEEIIEKLIK